MTSATTVLPRHERLIRAWMPELDSLRGVAILLVLFLHGFAHLVDPASFTGIQWFFVTATSYGWIGVHLFFVLSGLLITGILLDSRSRPGYYRRFYTRRALRILPAYYALLLLLGLLSRSSWLAGHHVGIPFVLFSVIYLSNLTPLFGIPIQYTVLWSLAVEEHFYLVWPAIVRRVSVRSLAFVALAVFVSAPVVRLVSLQLGSVVDENFYTWCNADGLALGALLSVVLRGSRIPRSVLWGVSGVAAILSAVTLAWGARLGTLAWTSASGFALRLTILNIGLAGLVVITLLLGTSPAKGLVNLRALRFLGEISYGLYLIHMLFFYEYDRLARRLWPSLIASNGKFGNTALQFLCAASASIGVAALSRRYFEEYFLRLKDRLAEPKASPPDARTSSPQFETEMLPFLDLSHAATSGGDSE